MSGFTYHLSVPIDNEQVFRKLKAKAKEHNTKGKLAPCVLDFLTGFVNGEFVRIAPSTQKRSSAKRRIE